MTETPIFTLERGTAPLLISIPHVGTQIPASIAAMNAASASRSDDDTVKPSLERRQRTSSGKRAHSFAMR